MQSLFLEYSNFKGEQQFGVLALCRGLLLDSPSCFFFLFVFGITVRLKIDDILDLTKYCNNKFNIF